MNPIRQLPPFLVVGLVVLGVALAPRFGIPEWVVILVFGGGLVVFYLVARMMGYPREADEPAPMQDCLPESRSEKRRRWEIRPIDWLLDVIGEFLWWR